MRRCVSWARHAGGRTYRHALVLLFGCFVALDCLAEPWRIVILLGADPTQPAAIEQIRALRQGIGDAAPDGTQLYIDTLDGLRFDGSSLAPAFVGLMKSKYQGQHIDLVIGISPIAMEFARRYHAELWPGTPVLLASIDKTGRDAVELPADFAYQPLEVDFPGTLDIIDRLQPGARRLVVVSGSSPNDQYWARRVGDAAASRPAKRPQRSVEFWNGVPLEALRSRLAALDTSTAVIFTTMYRDTNGRTYFPYEVVREASAVSRAPIYGWSETYLDYGMTAGSVIDFKEHGRRTAMHALALLHNAPVAPVAPVAVGAAMPADSSFCAANIGQMERLGLHASALPPGCRQVNVPPSIWREHRATMLATVAVLLLQGMTIFALLWQRRKRRVAESEAAQRSHDLARAARVASVGELSASIAHEVNQPLGAILSNAAAGHMMMDADGFDAEEVRQILVDVRRDAERASQIVQRQRAMLQRHEPKLALMAPDLVIEEALEFVRPEARKRGCVVESALQAPAARIQADTVQLQQMLVNLVVNAIDASEGMEPPRGKISVATELRDGQYALSVTDRGAGIPPELAARIFESFFTTKHRGIGLGLSIVRTIVLAHGGRIAMRPHSGGGTVFEVLLPLDLQGDDLSGSPVQAAASGDAA